MVLANDLWKKKNRAPLHDFNIPQCRHPPQLGLFFFNACCYGNQTGTLLILTVLTDSTHEPWRTDT